MLEAPTELLAQLQDAAEEALEAANRCWELAYRLAESSPAEGGAWEAKVRAMTLFLMVLAAAEQVAAGEAALDSEIGGRLYRAAEDSLRASLSAWTVAFDTARAGGNDGMQWIVEEAAWNATRRANLVCIVAWELGDELVAAGREAVREALLGVPAANDSELEVSAV